MTQFGVEIGTSKTKNQKRLYFFGFRRVSVNRVKPVPKFLPPNGQPSLFPTQL